MKDRVACIRCGRQTAFSEEQLARLRSKQILGDVPFPPPIPPRICMRCAFKDLELHEPLHLWMQEVEVWGDQKVAELIQRARVLAVRPLEAIDQFVDSLR